VYTACMPTSSALNRLNKWIALAATLAIALHLVLNQSDSFSHQWGPFPIAQWPLIVVLLLGGTPLVLQLLSQLLRGEFGSDLLAGLSIVTSVLLGEHLAGTLVVLMLSGGEALEAFAVSNASSVLKALARRMPTLAHCQRDDQVFDLPVDQIQIGDVILVYPFEACPVDATVIAGTGSMDESFLTGEPYHTHKSVGSSVISGAVNGEAALTIRAEKTAVDSRYAQILQVMQTANQQRPQMRRIGDSLGAAYTPLAIVMALIAWWCSGDVTRFLAVLVVATPCPLLIAIPVAIIGSISLAARRGIIIRDPVVLERLQTCRVAIFDKTGTLTYGQPKLVDVIPGSGVAVDEALALVASLEMYSKHPLATAITSAAQQRQLPVLAVTEVHEKPGEGLVGQVGSHHVRVTGRSKLSATASDPKISHLLDVLPPQTDGMECIAIIDGRTPVTFRFRDQPRADGVPFIRHLGSNHHFEKVMIVSGDREAEVRYLADLIGIREVHFETTPEQKLEIVRQETRNAPTVFVGDGINDAPALTAATVGIAVGSVNEIASQAAQAVVLDRSLSKLDELFHIGAHTRRIALESAVGGILLSIAGMILAAFGLLSPVVGAIMQEVIDLVAVLNALRASMTPRQLTDYQRQVPGSQHSEQHLSN